MQLDKLAFGMLGATHGDASAVAPAQNGCLSNSSGESCFRSSARMSYAISEDINSTTLLPPVLPNSRIRSAAILEASSCLRFLSCSHPRRQSFSLLRPASDRRYAAADAALDRHSFFFACFL